MGRIILDPNVFRPSGNIRPERQQKSSVASQWTSPQGVTAAVRLASLLGGLRLPKGLSDPAVDAEGQALQYAAQQRAEAKGAIEKREIGIRKRTDEMTAGDVAAVGKQGALSEGDRDELVAFNMVEDQFRNLITEDEGQGFQRRSGQHKAEVDQARAFRNLSKEDLTKEQYAQARPDFVDRVMPGRTRRPAGSLKENLASEASSLRANFDRDFPQPQQVRAGQGSTAERMTPGAAPGLERKMRQPMAMPSAEGGADPFERAGGDLVANLLMRGESAFSNIDNPAVRAIQGNLLNSGYGVTVDGQFGTETLRAMQAKAQDVIRGAKGPQPLNLIDGYTRLPIDDLRRDANGQASPAVEALTRADILNELTEFRKNKAAIVMGIGTSGGDTRDADMYEELLMGQLRRKSKMKAAYEAGEIAGFEELGVRYPGIKRKMTEGELQDLTELSSSRFLAGKRAEDPYYGLAPSDALVAILEDAPEEVTAEGQRKLKRLAAKYTPTHATFGDFFFDTKKERISSNIQRLDSLFPEIKTGPSEQEVAKTELVRAQTDLAGKRSRKLETEIFANLKELTKSRGDKKRPELDKHFQRLRSDVKSVLDNRLGIEAKRFNVKISSQLLRDPASIEAALKGVTTVEREGFIDAMNDHATAESEMFGYVRKGQEAEARGNYAEAERNYQQLMKLLYGKPEKPTGKK